MKLETLNDILTYKIEHNLDLPTTAKHFNIGVNRLRRLLHDNNITISKRKVTKSKETIKKIRESNLKSKDSPFLKYDWKSEYQNFINTNKLDKTIGISEYCNMSGYHPRYLRKYIRENKLHQPKAIPIRTEEWISNISKSGKGIIKNPKGSNGKLKGKSLPKEQRDTIRAGLIRHYYDMELTKWEELQDERKLYYTDVWRITKQQDIHLLENYDKRGNAGVDGNYQLDHIYPISIGFVNKIPAKIIGNIKNLQMLPWYDNRIKGNKMGLI